MILEKRENHDDGEKLRELLWETENNEEERRRGEKERDTAERKDKRFKIGGKKLEIKTILIVGIFSLRLQIRSK